MVILLIPLLEKCKKRDIKKERRMQWISDLLLIQNRLDDNLH